MSEKNVVSIIIEAIDKSGFGIKGANSNLGTLEKKLAIVGGAFAALGAAAVTAFAIMAKEQINSAEAMGEMAQKAGISTSTFSTMAFAAKQSGVELETLQTGFKKLSVNLFDASKGVAKSQEGFDLLQISIHDSNGQLKSSGTVLKEVADRFASMPDGARKAALAVQLFGKAGNEMIPMLNKGGAAIGELQAKARSLGLEVSDKFAENAHDFNTALGTVHGTMQGVVNIIVQEILPYLQQFAHYFADKGPEIVKWVQNFIQSVGALSDVWKFFANVVSSVWVIVKSGIERTVSAISTIAAAVFNLVTGNWRGVTEVVKMGVKDQIQSVVDEKNALVNIWTAQTVEKKKQLAEQSKAVKKATDDNTGWGLQALLTTKAFDLKSNEEKIAGYKTTLSKITELTKSNNVVLFRVGQAASLANATISGIEAVVKSLAAAPYPFNLALAGLTSAAVATELAAIVAEPAPAFASGGVVQGNPNTGDSVLARLTPQEVVLNAAQQNNVASQLAGSQSFTVNLTLGNRLLSKTIKDLSNNGQLDFKFA